MSIRNLDKIFAPTRIAVIGASDVPTSVGCNVLRNLVGSGFKGVVYPVNPKRESVQGIQAYKDVRSLPNVPDLAVICTPSPTIPELVHSLGEVGTRGIVIISAGFRETGAAGVKLEEQVRNERQKFPGMRIIGPNCLGIIVPSIHLNASFAAATPIAGHIGFISQSGALCTSVLDWAISAGIGFSYFVSVGNMLDVSMADLIDFFGTATDTQSIILYIESITESREFVSAARAFSRTKPIVAYKAGRFAQSAQAAASHTGAMAGVDSVYAAAFQRAGIERIFQVEDMFDCAGLLARHQKPKGDRVAIVTNAGGPGVMTTDHLLSCNGTLAKLSEETMAKFNKYLPAFWSHGNPVDILGDAQPDRYTGAVEIVLQDPGVDAVLVILTPQSMTDPTGCARALVQGVGKSPKPVLAAWMGANAVAEGTRILDQAGIPTYDTPEKAVRAFMHLVSYAKNLEILHETPREIPLAFKLDRQRVREQFDAILGEENDILSEDVLEDVVGRLRDSRDQADGRRIGGGGRVVGEADGLSRGDEDRLAADHAQDRGRRRRSRPRLGPRGLRRLQGGNRTGAGKAPGRDDPRRHLAENGGHPQRLRDDRGDEEGPGLRRGDLGGDGRHGDGGLPGPVAGPAAAERNARPPRARIAQVLAAPAGAPGKAGGEHRPPHRSPHAILLPDRRLPGNRGDGRQSAAGDP